MEDFMKNYIAVFVSLIGVVLAGCTSIDVDSSYLQANGDYVDINHTWNEHELTVQKVSTLNVFGLTQSEWESEFGNIAIYKAYSWANALTSEADVKQRAYDAIKIVAQNRNAKYYALLSPDTSSITKSYESKSYDTSTVSTSVGGKTVRTTTIQTPTTQTTNYTFYTFNSYVLYFDDEDTILVVRDKLGVTNIFETNF